MSSAKAILFWLALAFACFLPASALTSTAPGNRVWEIFSIGYDAASTEPTDLGNRTETSTSNYDTAPIHGANIEEIPTEANRTLFGQNAEFKAAEGGTTILYRGTSQLAGDEIVANQAFDVGRIAQHQAVVTMGTGTGTVLNFRLALPSLAVCPSPYRFARR